MSDPAMTAEAWAIKGPDGVFLWGTINEDISLTWIKIIHSKDISPQEALRKGYRAVRVRITEIEDE